MDWIAALAALVERERSFGSGFEALLSEQDAVDAMSFSRFSQTIDTKSC